jgi:hypothetical protein
MRRHKCWRTTTLPPSRVHATRSSCAGPMRPRYSAKSSGPPPELFRLLVVL